MIFLRSCNFLRVPEMCCRLISVHGRCCTCALHLRFVSVPRFQDSLWIYSWHWALTCHQWKMKATPQTTRYFAVQFSSWSWPTVLVKSYVFPCNLSFRRIEKELKSEFFIKPSQKKLLERKTHWHTKSGNVKKPYHDNHSQWKRYQRRIDDDNRRYRNVCSYVVEKITG